MKTGLFAVSAAALVAASGLALAAPTIDGAKSVADSYGDALWVNQTPTFRDNTPVFSVGNPEAVTTGIEIAIPLTAINFTGSTLRVSAFVSSGDQTNISNQVLASIPLNSGNLGSPTTLDFNTITGNQWVSVPANLVATSPTIDGTRDAGYGTVLATSARVQKNYTGYGDATHGLRAGKFDANLPGDNGSEINAVYAVRDSQNLYIFFSGNLEANNNRLNIFIDSVTGQGQNQLSGLPVDIQNLNGLRFDTGFDPDHAFVVNTGFLTANDQGSIFVDYCSLPTGGGGVFQYLGSTGYDAVGVLTGGTPLIAANPPAAEQNVRVSINNSNVQGVVGSPISPTGNRDSSRGSELNAIYGRVENNKLYLMLTGNVQDNFTKLSVFLDVRSGGQNRIRGASIPGIYRGNPGIDFNRFIRFGSSVDAVNANPADPADGLRFDGDFAADYWVMMTNGGGVPVQVFSNALFLRTAGRLEDFNFATADFTAFSGGAKNDPANDPITFSGPEPTLPISPNGDGNMEIQRAPRTPSLQIDQNNPFPPYSGLTFPTGLIRTAIDNSNIAGVTTTTATEAAALAVTTGMELEIDLGEAGWDGSSPIKVAAFIAGDNYDIIYNQGVGFPANSPAAGYANPRAVDFADAAAFPGNQYVVIPVSTGPTGCNVADITGIGGPPAGPDGLLTGDDFNAFIAAFAASDTLADITGIGGPPAGPDGLITGDDFNAFIAAFAAGCP
jgi:hypothetical protein